MHPVQATTAGSALLLVVILAAALPIERRPSLAQGIDEAVIERALAAASSLAPCAANPGRAPIASSVLLLENALTRPVERLVERVAPRAFVRWAGWSVGPAQITPRIYEQHAGRDPFQVCDAVAMVDAHWRAEPCGSSGRTARLRRFVARYIGAGPSLASRLQAAAYLEHVLEIESRLTAVTRGDR